MKTELDSAREILKKYNTIAMVGASPDPERDSNSIMRYLLEKGYRVIPVNPNATEILGQPSYPDLASVPEPIDIVDVFRAPDKVLPIVEQAIFIGAKVLWLQEGVVNEDAAAKARRAGMVVFMDRCIAKTHAALETK